jgi:hypothetical protein
MEEKLKITAERIYNAVEIPEELGSVVSGAIKKGKRVSKVLRFTRPFAVAAAFLLVFTGALNISEPFARAVSVVPVIGGVARVLTFRQYEEKTPSFVIRVKTPALSGLSDSAYQKRVNTEIDKRMSEIEAKIKAQVEKDREAFIKTGGKAEDFRPVLISIDYEVKSDSGNILSFVISKGVTSYAAYSEFYYYNIDVANSREITLEAIFGKDYITKINDEVSKQIAERIAKGEAGYFTGNMGFKTISDKQGFYINEKGNPVIVFEKYAITAGAYGRQFFEITPKK